MIDNMALCQGSMVKRYQAFPSDSDTADFTVTWEQSVSSVAKVLEF